MEPVLPQHNIALLNYPGAQLAALYGLKDMFEVANRLAEGQTNSVLKPHIVDLFEDTATHLHDLPTCAALIAPPSLSAEKHTGQGAVHHWIKTQHQKGALICSACAGAYLLAATGLLNGRTATTHWALKQEFSETYPSVQLNTDQLIVDEGDIITAGGVMAWTDLGVRVVERFLGPAIMLDLAHQLLIEPGRCEQRLFSAFRPELHHGDAAILKVQHWLQTTFTTRVTVKGMAEHAGLTSRTFLRRFYRATGLNPKAYLQLLRVEKARRQLELTPKPVNEIAWAVGYEDPTAFRRIFLRIVGLPPGEYRKRFSVEAARQALER